MKNDDYLELDFKDLKTSFPLERREFLKLFGGGVFVFFAAGKNFGSQEQRRQAGFRQGLPSDFNAFLQIGADGRVACFTGKIEMGQGVVTSLAQMLAEELDVPLGRVEMVMGDTDLCPWDGGTFGSMSTRFFGPALREAAAEARAVLKELAAERLRVPVDRLEVKQGAVLDKKNSQNQVSFGELTQGKRIERHLEKKPPVKDFSEFKIIGKPALRHDAYEKVTGKAKFAGDINLPGMLYARILRPPAHGAKLKHMDTTEARAVEGAIVIEEGELVAVLHLNPEEAGNALKKIKADWEVPEINVDDQTIFDHLLKMAPAGEIVSSGGNLQEGQGLADSVFEKKYLNSYVSHAPLEPHTAVAMVEDGKVKIWASTQTPFRAKEEIAQTLGLQAQNVQVITPYVGGGFGGKTANRQAVEAARMAKLTGKPVQVAWTREEEFFFDTFRPAAIVKVKSGIIKGGKIVLWDYGVYFAGERGSQHFYDIPHHRTMAHGSGWRGVPGSHPFATGAWRAPANNTNTFAREVQVDLMAAEAGIDPLEFRLMNLKDKRMIRVLEAAAKEFGWTTGKAPSGRGWGISCGMDAGTYVAHMAEVEVDKNTGKVQVKRVVCGQDMGLVINPQGARIQMEGCITMGLGYALAEEVHFKGGRILDLNFDTYEIPRFSWAPKIECVLIEAQDVPPQGGGEPAIIGMGAVVANAIFDSSGARLFQLPMTPERIQAGLTKA